MDRKTFKAKRKIAMPVGSALDLIEVLDV